MAKEAGFRILKESSWENDTSNVYYERDFLFVLEKVDSIDDHDDKSSGKVEEEESKSKSEKWIVCEFERVWQCWEFLVWESNK